MCAQPSPARPHEAARDIRRAAPGVEVEAVTADLSTVSGAAALLDHVGERSIEALINNAGLGSYGPIVQALFEDLARAAGDDWPTQPARSAA